MVFKQTALATAVLFFASLTGCEALKVQNTAVAWDYKVITIHQKDDDLDKIKNELKSAGENNFEFVLTLPHAKDQYDYDYNLVFKKSHTAVAWDYKVITIHQKDDDLDKIKNELKSAGENNFEFVLTLPHAKDQYDYDYNLVFKKPVTSQK